MTRPYWRFRLAPGPLWRGIRVLSTQRLEQANIWCATTGGRSYVCAVNVTARTVEAKRTAQGGSAKGRVNLT